VKGAADLLVSAVANPLWDGVNSRWCTCQAMPTDAGIIACLLRFSVQLAAHSTINVMSITHAVIQCVITAHV
jgi:hypothetical protein